MFYPEEMPEEYRNRVLRDIAGTALHYGRCDNTEVKNDDWLLDFVHLLYVYCPNRYTTLFAH